MKSQLFLLVALCASLVASAANEPVVTDNTVITNERRMANLEVKLSSLHRQIALLEDSKAIERLQQAYGYYVSEGMGSEAAALFSDSPIASIELAQQGVYVGKQRIRAFLTHGERGAEARRAARIADHAGRRSRRTGRQDREGALADARHGRHPRPGRHLDRRAVRK